MIPDQRGDVTASIVQVCLPLLWIDFEGQDWRLKQGKKMVFSCKNPKDPCKGPLLCGELVGASLANAMAEFLDIVLKLFWVILGQVIVIVIQDAVHLVYLCKPIRRYRQGVGLWILPKIDMRPTQTAITEAQSCIANAAIRSNTWAPNCFYRGQLLRSAWRSLILAAFSAIQVHTQSAKTDLTQHEFPWSATTRAAFCSGAALSCQAGTPVRPCAAKFGRPGGARGSILMIIIPSPLPLGLIWGTFLPIGPGLDAFRLRLLFWWVRAFVSKRTLWAPLAVIFHLNP